MLFLPSLTTALLYPHLKGLEKTPQTRSQTRILCNFLHTHSLTQLLEGAVCNGSTGSAQGYFSSLHIQHSWPGYYQWLEADIQLLIAIERSNTLALKR